MRPGALGLKEAPPPGLADRLADAGPWPWIGLALALGAALALWRRRAGR